LTFNKIFLRVKSFFPQIYTKQFKTVLTSWSLRSSIQCAHVTRNRDENGSERRRDRTSKSSKSGSLTVRLCCIVKFIYVRI